MKKIFFLLMFLLAGGVSSEVIAQCQVEAIVSGQITCNGPVVTASAEVTPPGNTYFYTWMFNGQVLSGSPVLTITQPGFYSLVVTDSLQNCFAQDTFIVTSDPGIPTVYIASSSATCDEAVFTAFTNNPVATYLWNTGSTTESIQVNQSGTYCVTVTSNQGCTAQVCRNFFTGNQLEAEIVSFNSNICTDSLGMYVNISGGTQPFTYDWNTGENTFWILPAQSGWYSVTVTSENGCTASDSYYIETDLDDCGTLKGVVFADFNNDCQISGNDSGLGQFTIRIENSSGDVYHVYSNSGGGYIVSLPTGVYTLTPVLNNSPWAPCQPSYTVTVPFGGAVERNIPLQPVVLCPDMHVDVSVPFLRRCIGENTVYVQYCNKGTQTASAAYVDIVLDPLLIFVSSSVPHSTLGNNTYRFDIGNVGFNACGNFTFKVKVSCDAVLGQTHCVDATIFPHDPCPQASTQWSGASVKLSAGCNGTELEFRAKNTGNAPMTTNLEYVIIEDAVMLNMPPGNPLAAGEDRLVFTTPANGATWRIEAEQEPFHPGLSMPSLTVEGCTTGQTFSLGYVNQYELDDADEWKDIECRANSGSYDPNDKQGLPTGYGAQQYIKPGVDIEYLIRFQNTGTDTAFTVVIRDTLSAWLDPGSVVPGASSHPYRFDYYGDGFLKFVFDPIALPDSNVNVAGSQGFVSFRVKQMPDVPLQTDIYNRAAIYFDFNEPVITNRTHHKVGINFVTVDAWTPAQEGLVLHISPNPATDQVTLTIGGTYNIQDGCAELTDLTGRHTTRIHFSGNQINLERGQLPAGIYMLRITSEGKITGYAKLIFK